LELFQPFERRQHLDPLIGSHLVRPDAKLLQSRHSAEVPQARPGDARAIEAEKLQRSQAGKPGHPGIGHAGSAEIEVLQVAERFQPS
jgi:hypothetical protein